jgi:hypothetical protein
VIHCGEREWSDPTSQELTVKDFDRTEVLCLGFCEHLVEQGGQKWATLVASGKNEHSKPTRGTEIEIPYYFGVDGSRISEI